MGSCGLGEGGHHSPPNRTPPHLTPSHITQPHLTTLLPSSSTMEVDCAELNWTVLDCAGLRRHPTRTNLTPTPPTAPCLSPNLKSPHLTHFTPTHPAHTSRHPTKPTLPYPNPPHPCTCIAMLVLFKVTTRRLQQGSPIDPKRSCHSCHRSQGKHVAVSSLCD